MTHTLDVAAVVVSYNVRDLLLQCLASLRPALERQHLTIVVVVDNDSDDDSVGATHARFPDIRIIEAENLGYGAGANSGIAATSSEFVLVLNPDTVVPAGTIARLAEYMSANPRVGVAAPRLRYPDRTVQSTRRRFPRRLTPIFESTIFERIWPSNPWTVRYQMLDSEPDSVEHVDWVVGACLLLRRAAIEQAGGFNESFWMYCEDTELCWRLRRHGWKTAIIPDVEVTHHEAASSSQNTARRQVAFDRSRIELQRRLYGQATARLCAAGIKVGYVLDLALEGGKYLVGHKRDLRRQRVTAYVSLLRANLLAGAGPEQR